MALSSYTKPESVTEFENCSKNTMIAFAGSGCSYIPGIPTWRKFLEALNNTTNALVDLFPYFDKSDYYGAASAIYNALENSTEFYNGVATLIAEKTKTDFIAMHSAIWSTFDRVLTTNYDHCFEAALVAYNQPLIDRGHHPCSFNYQELPNLDFATFRTTDKSLAYLHGRAGSEVLVLRKEDYENFYPSFHTGTHNDSSNNLEEFLESSISEFSFVFIGFSMDDETFVLAFDRFMEKHKEQYRNNGQAQPMMKKHFIFLRNDDLKDWLNHQDLEEAKLDFQKMRDKNILKYHDNDPEKLTFQPNLKRAIERSKIDPEEELRIYGLVTKLEKNKKKLNQLERLNIFDIRLKGDDYNGISQYLRSLAPVHNSSDQIDLKSI